jgi:4'-phosphopantetheinyl transferase
MDDIIQLPAPGQVHVWTLDLRLPQSILTHLADCLSPDELERAGRFRFEHLRDRFIGARGFLRLLLAAYLDQPSEKLVFECGPAGKPHLVSPTHEPPVHFNLSHSDDMALLAVCCSAPVGIDIERVRELDAAADLVRRFFSPREAEAFCSLPGSQQAQAFFNLWTRKEALLKATGEGIAHSLNSVEVGFQPGEPVAIHTLPQSFGRAGDWMLAELPVPEGFVAALAVRATSAQIQLSPLILLDGAEPFNHAQDPGAKEVVLR